jgi:hypothetical protein
MQPRGMSRQSDRETDLSKETFPSLISFCKSSTAAVYVIWAKSLEEIGEGNQGIHSMRAHIARFQLRTVRLKQGSHSQRRVCRAPVHHILQSGPQTLLSLGIILSEGEIIMKDQIVSLIL